MHYLQHQTAVWRMWYYYLQQWRTVWSNCITCSIIQLYGECFISLRQVIIKDRDQNRLCVLLFTKCHLCVSDLLIVTGLWRGWPIQRPVVDSHLLVQHPPSLDGQHYHLRFSDIDEIIWNIHKYCVEMMIILVLVPHNRKEGNVLFNDALNTFYLRLYGIEHMVKDHSDSKRKPAAATWATLFD